MTTRHATVNLVGPGMRFVGGTGSGHAVVFDDEAGDSGARPIEVALAALGGCTAIDVIAILRKKRQQVTGYRVRLEGEQAAEQPHVYTAIRVVHEIDGDAVEPEAVRRAIELSASRYCSVGTMLAAGVTRISHWYVLRRTRPADDDVGEVIALGPHYEPGVFTPA
jgi:putative redox protein